MATEPLNKAGNEFAHVRDFSDEVQEWMWDEVLYLPWYCVSGMSEEEKMALSKLVNAINGQKMTGAKTPQNPAYRFEHLSEAPIG